MCALVASYALMAVVVVGNIRRLAFTKRAFLYKKMHEIHRGHNTGKRGAHAMFSPRNANTTTVCIQGGGRRETTVHHDATTAWRENQWNVSNPHDAPQHTDLDTRFRLFTPCTGVLLRS